MANSGSNSSSSSSTNSSSSSSSGFSGSGSNGGASTSGGSAATGASGGGASISDLTSQLKQLQDNGPVDLKLSPETEAAYLGILANFRNALQNELNNMVNMGSLGNPGSLPSAMQTKQNLDLDVSGLTGIVQAMTQYLNYLDEFETTVSKATSRLMQSG
ncbi:hypothetical protein [Mycobacterium sherrisii]|uniref:hypothetical protein n=1 Tax=Mycobacterium sherrisii TaxID=243061 RepID=UPI000A9B7C03|nr:hypothetical protein [Mycobacterium sherrisii]MCV7029326.1 hypothetical protein [Mycobacterium sherrisii]